MEKNFTDKFTKATASVKKDAFLTKIHANPKLTLKQVFDLGTGEFSGVLKQITVGDLLGARSEQSTNSKKAGSSTASRDVSQGSPEPAAIDTRTPAGREAYDRRVLRALSTKEWRLAEAIRVKVGGSPVQLRAALNRLIGADLAGYEGQARGTKYIAL